MALTGTEKTAYQKDYMAKRRQSGTRNVVNKDSARKRKNVLNRRRSFIVKEACAPGFHRVSKNRVRYGDAHVKLRPRTNDVRISTEVFSGCYKRTVIGAGAVSSDDVVWIDMGAHAGFFSIYAIQNGAATVYAYEAAAANCRALRCNTGPWPVHVYHQAVKSSLCTQQIPLYMHGRTDNTSRHCVRPVKGRRSMHVPAVCFDDVLKRHPDANAIKMDIEGEELYVLDEHLEQLPQRINALTFEYSYSVDEQPLHFKQLVARCRKVFKCVHHVPSAIRRPKTKGRYVKMYNRDVLVHCWNRRPPMK